MATGFAQLNDTVVFPGTIPSSTGNSTTPPDECCGMRSTLDLHQDFL
jgi:hypothetical protein